MWRQALLSCLSVLPALLVGCQDEQQAPAPRPPEVLVEKAVARKVVDYEFFSGRTDVVNRVELKAEVTGKLEKANFVEGGTVKKGDVLFVIEKRQYEAELARAKATLQQAQAKLQRLEGEYDRATELVRRGAMGREEYEQRAGERNEASASLGIAKANVDLAELNLERTEVRAPFAGRTTRRLVDPGNVVKANETVLTAIASQEPMYAYFDVDERTLLGQMINQKNVDLARSGTIEVALGLADEPGYPHLGRVNFVDNRLDPGTGTLWMRAEFTSPKRLIAPGLYVRVRFPLGGPHEAVLVPEQALGNDQGQKVVYVIDKENKAVRRPVEAGRQHDGMRVILSGVRPGEQVVVSGLQRVRAGGVVSPRPAPPRGAAPEPTAKKAG